MHKDFKDRLRGVREPWGTLESLAKKAETTYNTLQTWETAPPKKLDAYLLHKISTILNVDINWLLTGKGSANGKSDIDKPQDVNVSLSESKNTTREGIMSGERLDRYIQMLEDRVDALEAENAALREKKRDVR